MIEIGIFAAKAAIIVLAVGAIILLILFASLRQGQRSELEVEQVHRHLADTELFMKSVTLNKTQLKKEKKRQKEEQKKRQLAEPGKRMFLIHFKGDVKAHAVDNLREQVTAVLQLATDKDEVVVTVESPGGVVHGYGLGASQLLRFREKGIPLTVCVDKVAASGGYMMACVANQVIAAPFAILGSIGVVAQVPNFHRLLKKHEVDYKEYTAGDYKRTVSVLGEITAKGEQKFQEQLEDTHILFKQFVSRYRPQIKMEEIGTGEYWYGERAKQHGLIDEILTSDDYLLKAFQTETPIYEIKYQHRKAFSERLSDLLGDALAKAGDKVLQSFYGHRFF
jgi:serine protease SohB